MENTLWTKGAGGEAMTAYSNTPIPLDSYSLINQFRQAMSSAGISYADEIIADGKLQRFHIEGQTSYTKNGAYVLHLDGCPAGWFMDYKTGISQTWKSLSVSAQVPKALVKQVK